MTDFQRLFVIISDLVNRPFYIYGYRITWLGLILFGICVTLLFRLLVKIFAD